MQDRAGGPWAWEAGVVVDAAFARYLREAADYAGGRRTLTRGVATPSSLVAGAADDDAVLLDLDLDRSVPGPVLGVDRVVLDRGVEPQAVALLAVVEGALERPGVARARARRPRPPRRLRRRVRVPLGSSSSSASSPVRSSLLLGLGSRPRSASSFGGLELGGDQRVVLGAQVDLLGVVAGAALPSGASSSLTSSFWRLNCSMSRTVTSSWWATQASVRPWRTQARIWLRCGRRDFRGMDGPGD